MKIHETLDRDPRTAHLANDGQARIADADAADARAADELRAELETFVCEGQFADALQRILDRYLAHLGRARQQSAWVSGFFGSGKSHLLKMLTHLWVNTRFPDGAAARALVRGGLPDEIAALLRELDTQARRTGRPPAAAAGTLLGGSVDHVRAAVLAIVLRARGWPEQYPQARFCFWLRGRGLLGRIRAAVEAAGRPWLRELNDLYVSPVIAEALIDADPAFAPDAAAARQVLVQQFPQLATDVTTEQFVETTRAALAGDDGNGGNGELPLTVLVLDEVQQYVNEAQDRSAAITELAEAVQTQLDSRVMLVGAGQSALSAGTPALTWLRDRFRIAVELTDADVEAVTRKVLLRKKPSAVPAVEATFEAHAGEVARHLQGTRLGARAGDRGDRTPDYPLLCTRRRFWEACFQAVDALGSHSQLRSQLRIVHDALRRVAGRDLGAVIPASELFDALAADLVNTGVLLGELDTRIRKLDDGTPDGRLRRDLCGLVFLIGKLPREAGVDAGVRATAAALADLLVDDLAADSGAFRRRAAETLDALARDGVLMRVGDEFRLQTTEGAEWDRAFRERQTALRQHEVEIATRRDQLFGEKVQAVLSSIRLRHGETKLPRALALRAGESPAPAGDAVTVRLRDGWSGSLGGVQADARRGGGDDPTLYVHLPKRSADALRDRLVEAEAARRVLDHYGAPASPEGRDARESMESRRRSAEQARDAIADDLLRAATVLQGGGGELFGADLKEKLTAGVEASLTRLFPRFADGDHRGWEAALRRARDGSDQPLTVVGWDGAAGDHPVAREALAAIGAGARGAAVHKALKAAPYGWPQDAIDAVLMALHRGGQIRAARNGRPIAAGALDQAGIKGAEFRPERVPLATGQRIVLRGLFGRLGIDARSGEEEARAPTFLAALADLGRRAGGAPPLPPAPDLTFLEEATRLAGNEQLAAIHAQADDLAQRTDAWRASAERAAARAPAWELATALRRHADGLPAAAEAGPELDAVREQRALLADADPVAPLAARLAAALREALAGAHEALADAVERAAAALAGDATWSRLDAAAQAEIRRRVGLDAPSPLSVATDADLLRTLDARPLAAWRSELDAAGARTARALEEAAARLREQDGPAGAATTTVEVRRGTLADEAAVRGWLEEQEGKLLKAVRKGPVIVR